MPFTSLYQIIKCRPGIASKLCKSIHNCVNVDVCIAWQARHRKRVCGISMHELRWKTSSYWIKLFISACWWCETSLKNCSLVQTSAPAFVWKFVPSRSNMALRTVSNWSIYPSVTAQVLLHLSITAGPISKKNKKMALTRLIKTIPLGFFVDLNIWPI